MFIGKLALPLFVLCIWKTIFCIFAYEVKVRELYFPHCSPQLYPAVVFEKDMATSRQLAVELSELFPSLDVSEMVPGALVLYGNAECLFSFEEDVLMAVSRYGAGAVIVCAHGGISKRLLHDDVTLPRIVKIVHSTCHEVKSLDMSERMPDSLDGVSVVGWGDSNRLRDDAVSSVLMQRVLTFVSEGGVALFGMCPWGVLQLNPGRELEEFADYIILDEVGMCYTEDAIYVPTSQVLYQDKDMEERNLLRILQYCLDDHSCFDRFSNVIMRCCSVSSVATQALTEKLQAVLSMGQVYCPTNVKEITQSSAKAFIQLYHFMNKKYPVGELAWFSDFPGCMPTTSQPVVVTITLDSVSDVTHPLGWCLCSSGELRVTDVTQTDGSLQLQVGCHTDNISNCDSWKRWPIITSQHNVKIGLTLVSQFGGNLYITSSKSGHVIITIEGHLDKSPLYDMTSQRSVTEWPENRRSPGAWTDLCGRYVTVSLPSNSVRHIEDPSAALQALDDVILCHHDLRGTSPTTPEWIVCDVQPCVGYMHAGYPIVTHLDVADPHNDLFLLDEATYRVKGTWGIYHEIGHNMQRSEWTFEGTGEVTCNIFTLHAMEVISSQQPWIHAWLQDQMGQCEHYLTEEVHLPTCHSVWKSNPYVGLFIYAQLARDFGWQPYKAVFRRYEQDIVGKNVVNSDLQKRNLWVRLFSEQVKHNLLPLFEFWGIPVDNNSSLSSLPAYLPLDEVTRFNVERYHMIRDKYA